MDTAEAAAATQQQPPVLGGVAPYLILNGATAAADFYRKAFGATEVSRIPPDENGRTMHIHLVVNGGSLMLSDEYPEHGAGHETPGGFMLHLQVDDADAWWKRAIEAGAVVVLPLALQFWGDRYGQVRDPYGVLWSMGQSAQG